MAFVDRIDGSGWRDRMYYRGNLLRFLLRYSSQYDIHDYGGTSLELYRCGCGSRI